MHSVTIGHGNNLPGTGWHWTPYLSVLLDKLFKMIKYQKCGLRNHDNALISGLVQLVANHESVLSIATMVLTHLWRRPWKQPVAYL